MTAAAAPFAASSSGGRAWRGGDAAAIAAVALALLVGANLLTLAGSAYVSEGGTLLEKLHPAAYLAYLAAGLAWFDHAAHGDAADWLWRQRRLTFFLAAMTGCAGFALLFTGTSNLIVLLDNFLPAGCLGIAVAEAGDHARLRLRTLLQAGFAANAALALAEAFAGAHLLPLYLNGQEAAELAADFRPLALYDHPLTGAAATLIGLFLAPAGGWTRWAYLALLTGGLIAFGGRAALLAAALVAAAMLAARLAKSFRRRRLSGWRLLAATGVLGLATAALPLLLAAGIGHRLIAHGVWDASASTRLDEWRILLDFDPSEWLFGAPRPDLLDHLETLRLDRGIGVIENFALLMFATLGLFGFTLFAAGFASLMAWAWRRGPGAPLLVASFLVTISTSNSLGRKSPLLLLFVAAAAVLRRA